MPHTYWLIYVPLEYMLPIAEILFFLDIAESSVPEAMPVTVLCKYLLNEQMNERTNE